MTFRHLLALSIANFLPLPAAGTATNAAAEPESPAETPVILQPVIVTARSGDHPLEVTLDAKAPAQPIPAHDGADVLKSIPGFSVIRKGGTDGDPVLRGMAGSRLVVALDGQHVLGGCGNRMDPPTAYVFPAAYDRVTVLKGPQTVRHGPGNSAGVVLFESDRTRLVERDASLFATLTTGSFGRFDTAVDARAGTPVVYARAALTRATADDYTDGAGQEVHAAHERWSANGAFGWTPDAHTLVEPSTARSDGEAAYADRLMDGVKFDREAFALRVRREHLSPLVADVELQLAYNDVDHVMDNFSLRSFTPTTMMPNRAVSNPARRTLEAKAILHLTPDDGRTQLDLGLDHEANRHSLRDSTNQTTDPYAAKVRRRDADFRQVGLFGEIRQDLDAEQRLIGGLRADRWRAEDHRSVVRLGMMTQAPNPTADATRRATLASGFLRYERGSHDAPTTYYAGLGHVGRFPDYWELIKNESASSVSAFATEPEKTTQLDVGARHRHGAFEFTVSAWWNRVDDFNLVQSNFAKPAVTMGPRPAVITRNIDATTWGAEAGAGWRFAVSVQLSRPARSAQDKHG